MDTKNGTWNEKELNYWVHLDSNWVVRDYLTDFDKDGWVILDDREMMISCDWKETKEECMNEVEFIHSQEKKYGVFQIHP